MIIGKKYYFTVYISEMLFFHTILFLFRKFTKRLHSTSLTEIQKSSPSIKGKPEILTQNKTNMTNMLGW